MTEPMTTDAAVLATEAGNFDQISASLQGIMHQVESTQAGMGVALQGLTGGAAAQAFTRYQEAALVQKNALDEIARNIHTGGVGYTATDSDQGAAMNQTVQIDIR